MKNILVVGGAGGVGSVLVENLIDRGDTIIATVLDENEARQITGRYGATVPVHQVDLGNAEVAFSQLRDVISAMPHLDAVIVCAAIAPNGPVELTPLRTIRAMLEINCLSCIAVFQAAMPALRKSRGRIVFTSSASGRLALPFLGPYAASKFALEGVADAMRREAFDQGVKISLVEPGAIRTAMFIDQGNVESRLAALDPDDRERYEYLYRWFSAGVKRTLDTTVLEAGDVAAVLLTALDAEEPEARYCVGESAKNSISMAADLSDLELDEAIRRMIAS